MLFDAHTHAFNPKIADKAVNFLEKHYGMQPAGTGTIEDLLKRLDRAGLDKALLYTAATDPSQVIPANNWSIKLKNDHPQVVSFGTMHPDYQDMEKELDRLADNDIHGLKFHPDFQGFFLDNPNFMQLMEMIGDRFTLIFHIGDKLPPGQNPSCPISLAKLRQEFPKPKIIAAHMGGYLHWKWAKEYLVGKDIYMDTSSSLPFIDPEDLHFIFQAHPRERILFGSDYPLFDPGEEMYRVKSMLKLTDDQLEEIMTNAEQLI